MKHLIVIFSLIACVALAETKQNISIKSLRLQIWNHPEATQEEKVSVLRELLQQNMTFKEAESMLGPGENMMFTGSKSELRALMYVFPTGNIYIYYDPTTSQIKIPSTRMIQR